MQVETCSFTIVSFVLLTAPYTWQDPLVLDFVWANDNFLASPLQNRVPFGIGQEMTPKRHSACTFPAISTSIVRRYARIIPSYF
eukprot:8599407-Prorocentrum_lima.AAC.1